MLFDKGKGQKIYFNVLYIFFLIRSGQTMFKYRPSNFGGKNKFQRGFTKKENLKNIKKKRKLLSFSFWK